MSLFRLLRLPNLLIVALVQSLLYFYLLLPTFAQEAINPRLKTLDFCFLVLATLCTTACGYIINDLYDYEMDLHNRKSKVIVNVKISAKSCIWIYALLGYSGFLLSLYLAFRIGQVYMISLYILSFGLLYLYTKTLKKRPLLGNILVSLFCAGVAGLVWLAELPGWRALQNVVPQTAQALQSVIIWYCAFAFLSTLFREIVKDLEDKIGDEAAGCRTFPIAAGDNAAKYLAISVAALLLISLGGLYIYQFPGFSTRFFLGALIGVVAPLIYAIYLLQKAQKPSDYHHISNLAKGVMLAGVLLLLL
ncbi:MAG: geranylgeranylglycerol-phosphate geranylgeranyltransferase [Haliscomenobacter sp.]|uniref:geranylgeranylglycerol-phosphate geranylgeranyltransferase n=1 Tax=Haliscomenobacter sp. TaxID=2717303 RepID=UPI0029BF5594|nr:geranylgeranylglycerol-phosphate geranylgeranyltransferase [Haliscomenobacter sp.]MDX2068173.1 geranylgeranylglycerol-phosphate geranylgeranyltransferase [Haliscomenobacter sp.]